MTAITASRTALEDAAAALHNLALQTRDISTRTGVHIWEALAAAVPHVRSGELGSARDKLVTLGNTRQTAQQVVERALGILDQFGSDTRTAIVA